jgi:hypothetical protein
MLKAILETDEKNYPELLGSMLVINAPSVVSVGWRLMKPFVDASEWKKICVEKLENCFMGFAKDTQSKIQVGLRLFFCLFVFKAQKSCSARLGRQQILFCRSCHCNMFAANGVEAASCVGRWQDL